MAPRGIICHMCGGEFFKQSLPIHQKACAAKLRHILLLCQHCNKEVPKLELEEHLARCPKAPKRKTAGQQSSEQAAAGEDVSTVFDSCGRLQCAVCGRWFNADRVAKHQGICERTSQKKRAVFDSFKQRKFDALIHRAAPGTEQVVRPQRGFVRPPAAKPRAVGHSVLTKLRTRPRHLQLPLQHTLARCVKDHLLARGLLLCRLIPAALQAGEEAAMRLSAIRGKARGDWTLPVDARVVVGPLWEATARQFALQAAERS
ncbi:hypothetical protein Esti_002796 [Eimeria stiedai]